VRATAGNQNPNQYVKARRTSAAQYAVARTSKKGNRHGKANRVRGMCSGGNPTQVVAW